MLRSILIIIFIVTNIAFSRNLTIDDAVKLGLDNNKIIKTAKKQLEYSEYRYKEALSGAFPKIDAQIRYLRNIYTEAPTSDLSFDIQKRDTMPYTPYPPIPISRVDSQLIQLSNGLTALSNGITKMTNSLAENIDPLKTQLEPQDNDVEAQLTLVQPLYVGGKVGTAIKIAKVYKQMSQEEYQNKVDSITMEIKKAYYNAVLAKMSYEVLKEAQHVAQVHLEQIKTMHENGLVSEYELSKAKVNILSINPEVTLMENQLHIAKNYLKTMIGIPITEEIILLDSIPSDVINFSPTLDFEKIKNSYQVKNLDYLYQILNYNVRIEKGGHYPTVAALVAYNFISKNSDLSKTFDKDYAIHNVACGIQVNIPIYSGGGVVAKTEQALINTNKIELMKEQVTELLKIKLHTLYSNIITAKERLNLNKEALEEAQLSLKIAQESFKNGVGTQTDVLDAQINLKKTKLERISIIKDIIFNELEYKYLTNEK